MRSPSIWTALLSSLTLIAVSQTSRAEILPELRVGRAGHAFDHLGGIDRQAEAAAASGATILYATGLGARGYHGLPPADQLAAERHTLHKYVEESRQRGIELVLGYLCATSIVGLETFDRNWSSEFRDQFATPAADWRQRDRQGNPLASWYGGEYQPACMNHPDWRAYQRFMVRQQLETGHDGVFFDNPTVHPNGCYCAHCMERFAALVGETISDAESPAYSASERTEAIRRLADGRPQAFLRFRCTIARDFLADMRALARTINPRALITCNNSLNAPTVLYAQCRTYAYNIWELSKAEDFVVVEDMVSQPRAEADGTLIEYGHMYRQLHAISHGKPLVAVTIAAGDYHTPPNLVRLAMAEAAAHRASYLAWPTWPEEQRQRMIAAIRPQADLLREHESLLNETTPRADVLLFLPFRRWVETDHCAVTAIAAALTRANVPYRVISEDDFRLDADDGPLPVLLVESKAVLNEAESDAMAHFTKNGGHVITADQPDWFPKLQSAIQAPSLKMEAPATVRAVVHDQPHRSIVHLFNLNVRRLSSFEDEVTPAENIKLAVRVPESTVGRVSIHTADAHGTSGELNFSAADSSVEFTIPRLEISAIVIVEQ